MTWHTFPHVPEDGAHILVKFVGCEEGNYFEVKIRGNNRMTHIEKWCYYEDYKNVIERKLLNEAHF